MSYEPRGKVKIVLEAMRAQDPDLEWTTTELVEIAGLAHVSSLSNTLAASIKHKLLFSERRGKATVYSLTRFRRDDEPVKEPVPFNACLWANGDLDLCGMVELENDGWRIAAENVPKLRALLAGDPA